MRFAGSLARVRFIAATLNIRSSRRLAAGATDVPARNIERSCGIHDKEWRSPPARLHLEHDPEKCEAVSEKIMLKQEAKAR